MVILHWSIFILGVLGTYFFIFSNMGEKIRIWIENKTKRLVEEWVTPGKIHFGKHTVMVFEVILLLSCIGTIFFLFRNSNTSGIPGSVLLILNVIILYIYKFVKEKYGNSPIVLSPINKKICKYKDKVNKVLLEYVATMIIASIDVYIGYLFSLLIILIYFSIDMGKEFYFMGLLITPILLVAMIYCVNELDPNEAEKKSNARRVVVFMGLACGTIWDSYNKFLDAIQVGGSKGDFQEIFIASTLVLFISLDRLAKSVVDGYGSIKKKNSKIV